MIKITREETNRLYGRVPVREIRQMTLVRVMDAQTGAYALIPFLIDTGSPVTIISRMLLKGTRHEPRMFNPREAARTIINGYLEASAHPAFLHLPADPVVHLPKTHVFVTANFPVKHGLLGMDVLRHLEIPLGP